ncbi:MAG: glycosyltransferase family 39 protein [Anaerolineae bacterium]|nr:glycosyltransferase family 39 protein [Anaerolineae bacterium]
MNDIIAWVVVGLTLAAGYGWSARLLREQSWTTTLLGLALGIGALTLIMVWESLLGIPLTFAGITLPYFVVMLPGWWRVRPPRPRLPKSWDRRFMLLALLAISAAVLFNSANLPFHRDDALGIYQPAAQTIYRTGALVPLTGADSLYRAYPILVPLSYAYAYFASGWENEYLAKIIATLLSLACLPAAYVLGKRLRNDRTGWLAALALALTPFFSRWASSGYVDLPMAFFYTLAAVFALRLYESQRALDALLAGVLVGLAAWTKNAALIGVGALGLWLAWCWLNRRIGWRQTALSLIACAVIAAPWYARNLVGAGFIMPDTAWTDQAQRTLENALVFVTHPENFGVPGWLIVAGVLAALPAARRREPGILLLVLWTLPFMAAWWLFVSYDPRFVLLFLPPLCVLAADLLARLWVWLDPAWRPPARIVLIIVTLLLAAPVLFHAVEYKTALLRNPLMTDAEKRALVGREP